VIKTPKNEAPKVKDVVQMSECAYVLRTLTEAVSTLSLQGLTIPMSLTDAIKRLSDKILTMI
jgi:hypothetical protein